ncbi:MAG: hypothetical protein NAOJABEB_01463 [Steroidobacteraceae bacterium]|nr:hypothetical protein [Steroidobacteraceae bacterium]
MSTPDFDPELERRWRGLSTEEPGPTIDEAIRAAARRTAAQGAMRRRPTWQRVTPFAAAAAVGVIAFVLVRQSPAPAPAPARMPVPAATTAPATTTAPAATTAPAPSAVAPTAVEPSAPAPRQAATSDLPTTQAKAPPSAATESSAREIAQKQRSAEPAPPPKASTADEIAGMLRAHAPAAARAIEVPAPARAHGEGDEGLPAHLADRVRADAATRLGVDPDAVTLVRAEAVTWSDGSLGCRTPGEMAIQVLTPGFRVVVEAGGTQLVYHTDTRDQVRFCPRAGAVR